MTDNLPEHQGKRWHDNRGELSETMDLLESIPMEVRPHIALALSQKADQQFQAGEILRGLKSLGKDKIMALHQARKKRRSYDQDTHLSEIATTFFVLPHEAQEGLAKDFLEFTELVVEYMANCDTFELAPSEKELVGMRDAFVQSGADAVRDYLHQVHKPFYDRLSAEAGTEITPEADLSKIEEGTRIKNFPPD